MKFGLRQAKAKFFMWASVLSGLLSWGAWPSWLEKARGLGVCVGTPPGPDPGRTHLKEDLDVVKGWDWPNTHCLPAVIYGSWLAPP